jgi:hypothetical protein
VVTLRLTVLISIEGKLNFSNIDWIIDRTFVSGKSTGNVKMKRVTVTVTDKGRMDQPNGKSFNNIEFWKIFGIKSFHGAQTTEKK